MLPNQFCYQVPLQFYTMQSPQPPMHTGQNYNSIQEYSINPLFQSSIYPNTIQNPGPFFNYLPCQMPMTQFSLQTEQEQIIGAKINQQTRIEQSPQILKKQTSQKNQKQKVNTEGCICSKTGCVKEYCRCFKNGKACGEQCRCHQCRNLFDRQVEVITKVKNSKTMKCNCKKSKCSNKYCDCLVAGLQCGKQCNCCDCSNN